MKFLYVVAAKSISDLALALIEMGHTVALVSGIEPDPINPDEAHMPVIADAIEREKPDYVISYLFIPIVSQVTHSYGIPYISWTYDSPLTSLFCRELEHDNNYAFVFDKQECLRLKSLYNANVYYLPMAANPTRIGAIDLKDEEISKFSSDISFIGTLYQENAYNSYIGYFDELTQFELKHYLLTHLRNWNEPKQWPSLSEHAVKNITETLNAFNWNTTGLSTNEFLGLLFLTRKLAEIDRVTLLNALAEKHSVDLYTGDTSNPSLINVNCHGRVDYNTEMSKIFYCSKINLNITLPSIESGIPQRVYDIMACGGFCLSNYQPEMDELFTVGSDIEAFRSVEELLDKTDYYLKHEDERLRIAINGYKLIKEKHTIQHRVNEMLQIASLT